MIERFAIATVAAPPGRIGICRLPGRSGALADDVAAIRAWGPEIVVSMTEAAEMEELGAEGLPAMLAGSGLAWRHFPIVDFGVPSPRRKQPGDCSPIRCMARSTRGRACSSIAAEVSGAPA